jgi:AraC family transcriptional regulator
MKSHKDLYETRHSSNDLLATHRHRRAYAALVIDGNYVEVGPDGSIDCAPGTLLLHPAFHTHGNYFGNRGARVVNVLMPDNFDVNHARIWRLDDLREAREMFERCHSCLPALLALAKTERPRTLPTWQQEYLRALRHSDEPITAIAARIGVSASHASRAVFMSHGMSPQRLRLEWRWRQAMSLLMTNQSLVDIATQTGFADQSHLTRTIRACTGHSPTALRSHIKYVQDFASIEC